MTNVRVSQGISSFVKARTPQTHTGVSNVTATVITPQTIELNGKSPDSTYPLGTMGYRIGVTDRVVGSDASEVPAGFVVLNTTNGNVFQNIGGEWFALGAIDSFDQIDPTLIPAWNNTIPGVNGPGVGYSVTTSERTIGSAATGYPEGFLVLNQCTGHAFVVSGGLWASGSFPSNLLAAWYEQEGVDYVESTIIHMYGRASIVS
jgi:hypothetical protein